MSSCSTIFHTSISLKSRPFLFIKWKKAKRLTHSVWVIKRKNWTLTKWTELCDLWCAGSKRRWKSMAFQKKRYFRQRICTSVATFRKSRSASTPWVDWYVTHLYIFKIYLFTNVQDGLGEFPRNFSSPVLCFHLFLNLFPCLKKLLWRWCHVDVDAETSRIHGSSHGSQNGREKWTWVHRRAITCPRGTCWTSSRI